MQITIDQLRRHLGHYVALAAYGKESLDVSKNGRPAIRIMPAQVAETATAGPPARIMAARKGSAIECAVAPRGARVTP